MTPPRWMVYGPTTSMVEEVQPQELTAAVGKRVEILAFGISYVGRLKDVDLKAGTVRIEDKGDYAVLEIERIESFRVLGR